MKNKRKQKSSFTSSVVSSLACLVLGIVMIVSPNSITVALCYTLGTALTIYGLFNIILFFINRKNGFIFEMIAGVLATSFGIFSLISPDSIREILFFIIGIVIIIDSTLDIKHALALKMFGMKYWWVYLILSIAVISLGICTIVFSKFFANFIIILLGALLIYEGISGLSITGLVGYHSKKYNSVKYNDNGMIEVEAYDKD